MQDGAGYLRRATHDSGGVHKYYYPAEAAFEPRTHTVYTASTVLTLLKLEAWHGERRPEVARAISQSAGYLLRMQSTAADATSGGFFYSYDLLRGQHDCILRVGTTSKAVYTLLALHGREGEGEGDPSYLLAAVRAGDFLLRLQRPDGSVHTGLSCSEASGAAGPAEAPRESLLYTGQVLSALSRLHAATGEPRFLDGAARTALYLQEKVAKGGCYLGDDYRRPNPVSSSWVVMSLLDFARATGDGQARRVAFRCGERLAQMQHKDPAQPAHYGRWRGSLSSSGTGWLAEVMTELHEDCVAAPSNARCEVFRDAALSGFRLLLDHTVTQSTPVASPSPAAAVGGIFWNRREPYFRTDSVCHGLNAYLNLLPHLPDGELFSLSRAGSPATTLAVDEGTSPSGEGDDE